MQLMQVEWGWPLSSTERPQVSVIKWILSVMTPMFNEHRGMAVLTDHTTSTAPQSLAGWQHSKPLSAPPPPGATASAVSAEQRPGLLNDNSQPELVGTLTQSPTATVKMSHLSKSRLSDPCIYILLMLFLNRQMIMCWKLVKETVMKQEGDCRARNTGVGQIWNRVGSDIRGEARTTRAYELRRLNTVLERCQSARVGQSHML